MLRAAVTATLAATLATTLAACGSAVGRIPGTELGVSARDAYLEARSVARSWAPDASLRWIEGQAIGGGGVALPEAGAWTFHYTAPAQARELLVRVRPLETISEERPITGPPGYVIGDNALGTTWIDSREAVAAAQGAGPDRLAAPLELLLIPTRPPQWVIRGSGSDARRRVHAETGEVLEP